MHSAPPQSRQIPNCADTEAGRLTVVKGPCKWTERATQITQARASFLLDIPKAKLQRISKESGLGHVERAGNEEETYFTYEELQRICMLAAQQMQAVH